MNRSIEPREAILVLGMHRSGTSALTRVLALCGASLPARLMPAAPESNETGFWESQVLVDLHDEVLSAMGSSWSDIRSLPQAWFSSAAAEGFRSRLAEVLAAEFADARLFVVKDPRLCRLLPLWLPVLAARSITPRIVIPIRHPLEVAASLNRREGFDHARGQALWRSYMLAAEHESRGLPRCFVTYDNLLTDWRGVVARIGAIVDHDWSATADAAAIDAFLSSKLRHHVVAATDTTDLAPGVDMIFAWMTTAAAGVAPNVDELDQVAANLAIAETFLGPVIVPLETALAQKSADLDHWIDAAVQRYAVIEDLRAEIARRDSQTIRVRDSRVRSLVASLRALMKPRR
ncbi:sulfotransferase family protein [Acidiphilium sp.]|uniref:sulfotransferase family protein n=1 Tax=Acidiphilium sp. TaxID=527 RepID=UPI003CFC4FE5